MEHLDDALVGHEIRSEEHTSELQSHSDLVCRLLLEKKKTNTRIPIPPSYSRREAKREEWNSLRGFSPGPPSRRITGASGSRRACHCLFFFNATATTEIYTLSLHDALPI